MEMSAGLRDASPQLQALLDERVLDLPDRLLDLLPVGVYVCDQAGLIVRYNRAAAELWGCSPQLGDPAVRYCGSYRLYGLNGSLVPHAKCPMADVLATGAGTARPGNRHRATRWHAHCSAGEHRGDQGRHWPGGRRGECLPRKARANDPAHIERTRADFHRASAGVARGGLHHRRCRAASRSTTRPRPSFGGCRPELGKSEFCGSWKLYWPDGTPLPHDECPMALALREKRPIRGMEAIAERPDGTRIPFIPYPTPLFDAAGTLIGAVNTLVDITERHEADKQIRESEARYRGIAAIVESSDDAILAKNLDGIITSWNQRRRAAIRLHGRRSDRQAGHDADPGRSARRGAGNPRPHSRRRACRPLRNHPAAQGWKPRRHFADDLAGARSRWQDHRRVEDRPRHQRAQAGGGAAAHVAPRDGPSRQEPLRPRRRGGCAECALGKIARRAGVGRARATIGVGAGTRAHASGDDR